MSRLALMGMGGPLSIPYPDSYISSANGGEQEINAAPTSSAYTFSNVTIGAADSRRVVVLAFSTNAGTNCTHTAVTANAGAITFAKIAENSASASANSSSLWVASVPSGTVLTAPVLTVSADSARATMNAWVHGRGTTALDTIGANSGSGSIDIVAGGLIIAYSTVTSASATSCDWTGVAEDFDLDGPSALWMTGGRYTGGAEIDRAIAASYSAGSNQRVVAAAFGAPTS